MPFQNAVIMGAYNRFNQFVVLKLLSAQSSELAILQKLASPALRRDKSNHAIPVLEVLRADRDWVFVVMPSWELTLRECVPLARASEYLMIGIQCLEVSHLDSGKLFNSPQKLTHYSLLLTRG